MSGRPQGFEKIGSSFREKAMRFQDWLSATPDRTLPAICRALFAAGSVLFVAISPASAAQRAYRLQPFSALELDLPAHYVIRNANAAGVQIQGPPEVIDRIVVEQHDDRTAIYVIGNISIQGELLISVDTVGLTALEVNGAGRVEATGFGGSEFSLKQQGAADVSLTALDVDKLRVEIQGSGKLSASGRATKERMRLAGAGEYRASNLAADSVEVKLEGAGDVEVMARRKLDVRISGAGNVRYLGDPKLEKDIEGAGTVSRM
jgi:hypothetical protein